MPTRLKRRANRAKSGLVNFSRRLSRRAAIKREKDAGAWHRMVLGAAPYRMVRVGVSIRRSPDPPIRHWPDLATDGLTDDRIRQGGDDGHGKGADRRSGGARYLLDKELEAKNPRIGHWPTSRCLVVG